MAALTRSIVILSMIFILSCPAFAAAGNKVIYSEGCTLSIKRPALTIKSGPIFVYMMDQKTEI